MDEVACETESRAESCISSDVVAWEDKPLVYISGPMMSEGNAYTNISNAIIAGSFARNRGWSVIVPHLDCLYAMVTGIADAEYYLDNDLNVLSRCDAVLVLPYKKEYSDGDGGPMRQTGTSRELDFAEDQSIPVFTIETLPWAHDFDRAYEVTEADIWQ